MTGNSLDSVVVDLIATAADLENFVLNFPQTFNLLAPNLFFLCENFTCLRVVVFYLFLVMKPSMI
jgi:hypothetical protein